MKQLMITSLIALALGSVNTASAFGLGDLAGAVGSAKANAAATPSVTAGDLDSFINAAKEADALISSSADSLFKNTQPKADVATHNQKVLAANNLTDPAKREEMLKQLAAEQMAKLAKVDWDKQARETPKLITPEQKQELNTAIYNFTLGTLKDKELLTQSKSLVAAVRTNPMLLARAGELTDVSTSLSNQLTTASTIATGMPKMASAVGLGALPSSASAAKK